MKHLIEDYKRRLKTITDILDTEKSNGSISDVERFTRLRTKQSEYRTFIAELERTDKPYEIYSEKRPFSTPLLEELHLHLNSITKEEFQKEWAEIKAMFPDVQENTDQICYSDDIDVELNEMIIKSLKK